MSAPRLHPWIECCQRFASTVIEGDESAACRAFVELAETVPRELPPAARGIVRRLLGEAWSRLLVRLTGSSHGHGGAAQIDSRVSRAVAAIEARFADPRFRLQTLARDLAVSPTHLTQLLKRDTGQTFGAHIHARRIAEARLLLAQPGLSIKEIAGRVGYASSSQLDRHFKRRLHCAPSAYRERLCAGPPQAAVRTALAALTPTQPATLPQK